MDLWTPLSIRALGFGEYALASPSRANPDSDNANTPIKPNGTTLTPPKALITGITGQDGSYLAEFLLSKGYQVHGLIRRASAFNTQRIDHLYQDSRERGARLFLHYGDLTRAERIADLIERLRPDEIYNLAAQSHVRVSFDMPEYTGDVSGLGAARMLEALIRSGVPAKFYQASSSEMFGDAPAPQNEDTPFRPRSPYACAKAYAHWMARVYREGYGAFAVNGVLFNHESPRRGRTFVTRKITRGIADIMAGRQEHLYLGNLDAKRDWGYAPEYVAFMWRMLQDDSADDYVIGSGESHSVREFLEAAFGYAGLDWRSRVKYDERYARRVEVDELAADSAKARERLGWNPKIGFDALVKIMVDADMEGAGLKPPGEGEAALRAAGIDEWSAGGAM